ncbi:hypothetical protein, partial [uncultured Intestinimonas sp.]|uniref:hypothetical protein n=1 Tax=uncultured Intestinimonas sp. TaxID=1689265 RepID=UPI00294263E0
EISLRATARGFESHPLRHVGANVISFAPTFLYKSERTHFAASPFHITTAALSCDLVSPLCGVFVLFRENIGFNRPFLIEVETAAWDTHAAVLFFCPKLLHPSGRIWKRSTLGGCQPAGFPFADVANVVELIHKGCFRDGQLHGTVHINGKSTGRSPVLSVFYPRVGPNGSYAFA